MQHAIVTLANRLLEKYALEKKMTLIGIEPRGVFLSNRILSYLNKYHKDFYVEYGKLDITFYRDDLRKNVHQPSHTDIVFPLDKKRIVLVDDVLYTGRTIRAALDALMDYGRPDKIELMVMINRKDLRELPIQPDYYIKEIETEPSQKVLVHWKEKHNIDEVIIQ